MSLINEALRRADAEKVRRTGAAIPPLPVPPIPEIPDDLPEAPAKSRDPWRALQALLLLGVVAALGLVAVYYLRGTGDGPPQQAAASPQEPVSAAPSAAPATAPASDRPKTSPRPLVAKKAATTKPRPVTILPPVSPGTSGGAAAENSATEESIQAVAAALAPFADPKEMTAIEPADVAPPAMLVAVRPAAETAQPSPAAPSDPAPPSIATPPAAPAPSPPAAQAAPKEEKPAETVFDVSKYKVTSIMGRTAVINGSVVEVGQSVGQAHVVAITSNSVELEVAGKRFTIGL